MVCPKLVYYAPLRAVLLTHKYPPEMGAAATRLTKLAALLVERGADVTVHTGFPNYPDGVLKPPYRNRPYLVEPLSDRLRVVRSAVYPAPNAGFAKRVANHAAFAASAVATSGVTPDADLVVAESPPLFTAAAGVAYASRKRARLVLNVSDQWPESAIQLGVLTNPRAIRLARALERWCYRNAAAVTVPTQGLFRRLDAIPEAGGKVIRLGPSVDASRFNPYYGPNGGPLRVLYAGTVGLAQGVRTLVEAARRAGPEVELTIAGDGAEAKELRDIAAQTANVRMLGMVPLEDVPRLYAEADAAAVLLRDKPLFADAIPIKTVEAMAAGRPVVLSARGEVARIIEEAGAGIVVEPEDADHLADALLRLARDRERARALGMAGRRRALERFDWARTVGGWWELLCELAGQPPEERPAAGSRSPVSRGLSSSRLG